MKKPVSHNFRRIILYTFSHNPLLKEFEDFTPFLFQQLRIDFITFSLLLEKTRPDLVIGFAHRNKPSQFETRAINQFHTRGHVIKNGQEQYELDFPPQGYNSISIAKGVTNSFCNWTAYKVSSISKTYGFHSQFVHLHAQDADAFKEYLTSLGECINTR